MNEILSSLLIASEITLVIALGLGFVAGLTGATFLAINRKFGQSILGILASVLSLATLVYITKIGI